MAPLLSLLKSSPQNATRFVVVLLSALAAVVFPSCTSLTPPTSLDNTRPFPLAAYLTAEQRLIASPNPYHWEDEPQSHLIEKKNPRQVALSPEEAWLSGKTWAPSNSTGRRTIYVDLTGQKAYVVQGDWVEAITRISSGRRGFRTPSGSYTISQKNPNHKSNLYGNYVDGSGKVLRADVDVRTDPVPEGGHFAGSPMPNFMRLREFRNRVHGVGLHAGLLPGYAASHGCIRLPYPMSKWLYDHSPAGTPVKIIDTYPLPEKPVLPEKKVRESQTKTFQAED